MLLISTSESALFMHISYNHRISQSSLCSARLDSFYPLPSTATNRRIHVISRTWTDRPLELNFLTQFECRWPFVMMASIGYGFSVQNCLLIGALHFLPVHRERERERKIEWERGESGANFAPVLLIAHSPQALWEIIKIAFENAVYIYCRGGWWREGKM